MIFIAIPMPSVFKGNERICMNSKESTLKLQLLIHNAGTKKRNEKKYHLIFWSSL
jgi:hypothetical protein